ncbi:MAG TPA: putative protein N(5)-glutamine methyltransferase [Propionibacteriaceae bacterium]
MSSDPAAVEALVRRLRAAGCVFAEDEARLLTEAAVDPSELESMVSRRVLGFPLEQLLGWAEFCGLRVGLEPGVFVPRQRTRFLVDQAAALSKPGGVVVDLCCGSGALGLALVEAVGPMELYATDIDPVAVRCAQRNLAGVGGRAYAGDLFAALPAELRGRVEVLLANVPYVPTGAIALLPPEARDHEPAMALDGGHDGLDVLRRVAAEGRPWLVSGGVVLVETGEAQAPTAVAVFTRAGWSARVAESPELGATVVVASSVLGGRFEEGEDEAARGGEHRERAADDGQVRRGDGEPVRGLDEVDEPDHVHGAEEESAGEQDDALTHEGAFFRSE